MKILYVCTANICRSPSAEFLTRDAANVLRVSGISAASAGVTGLPGAPGCDVAPALRGRSDQHRSRTLVTPAVQWADMILTAGRSHQAAVVDLDPAARPRTFTIRQAGRLARWLLASGMPQAALERAVDEAAWAGRYHPDDPRASVSSLGQQWSGWVIEELDAARGFAPFPVGEIAPDDIPDPHEGDPSLHALSYQQIWDATNSLVTLMQVVEATAVGVSAR